MTWTLAARAGKTGVRILCEDVPEGIRPQDHELGLQMSLANLAAFAGGSRNRRQKPRARDRAGAFCHAPSEWVATVFHSACFS